MSFTNWVRLMNDPFFQPSLDWGDSTDLTTTRDKTSLMPHRLNPSTFSPFLGADLVENDKNYMLEVDLPGVEPKNVDVSIDNNSLNIKAERKFAHEDKNEHYHTIERSFGRVQRKIPLPNNINIDKTITKFKNGVLEIVFPKLNPEANQPRKLTIDAEN